MIFSVHQLYSLFDSRSLFCTEYFIPRATEKIYRFIEILHHLDFILLQLHWYCLQYVVVSMVQEEEADQVMPSHLFPGLPQSPSIAV